jgi:hypothetical protein
MQFSQFGKILSSTGWRRNNKQKIAIDDVRLREPLTSPGCLAETNPPNNSLDVIAPHVHENRDSRGEVGIGSWWQIKDGEWYQKERSAKMTSWRRRSKVDVTVLARGWNEKSDSLIALWATCSSRSGRQFLRSLSRPFQQFGQILFDLDIYLTEGCSQSQVCSLETTNELMIDAVVNAAEAKTLWSFPIECALTIAPR